VDLSGIASGAPPGASLLVRTVTGATDLQQDQSLFWVMLITSIIGAAITWSFLAYAIWKYRDPATKGRRYG
jgi:hypothetical protein